MDLKEGHSQQVDDADEPTTKVPRKRRANSSSEPRQRTSAESIHQKRPAAATTTTTSSASVAIGTTTQKKMRMKQNDDDDDDDDDEVVMMTHRREKRLAMNRTSARVRRQRTKTLIESLQQEVKELSESERSIQIENEALKQRIREVEHELYEATNTIAALLRQRNNNNNNHHSLPQQQHHRPLCDFPAAPHPISPGWNVNPNTSIQSLLSDTSLSNLDPLSGRVQDPRLLRYTTDALVNEALPQRLHHHDHHNKLNMASAAAAASTAVKDLRDAAAFFLTNQNHHHLLSDRATIAAALNRNLLESSSTSSAYDTKPIATTMTPTANHNNNNVNQAYAESILRNETELQILQEVQKRRVLQNLLDRI